MEEEEPIEFLVSRRLKRSTAGNRMQAALAEIAAEDNKELDDDKDFFIEKDEKDIFESDFESTDEEGEANGNEDIEEKAVYEEERREKRTARSRLEKATAAAHARNKATFNPQIHAPVSKAPPKPKSNYLSLPHANAPSTGEGSATGFNGESPGKRKRKSMRVHTVLNTSATVKRIKESENIKATAPKKAKLEVKTYSQRDLLTRALDNEEGNIIEHRDYLRIEEEKRKQARAVKATIDGPVLRWVSRAEEVKTVVPPASAPSNPTIPMVYAPDSLQPQFYPYPPNSAFSQWPPFHAGQDSTLGAPLAPSADTPVLPQPEQGSLASEFRTEIVGKNYIIHELGGHDGVRKPTWNDSMEAMFGNHVKWDELRVYVGKGRPLSRPVQTCPITGKPALYLEPRTGVPFSDVAAYKVLSQLLEHDYVWSPTLCCYVGKAEPVESDP